MYQFIPAFHKANALSMLGLAFAVGSMFLIVQGSTEMAMICFVLAGLCDLFDGKFAGLFNRAYPHNQMGEFIDSFVDIIASVALPIVVLLMMGAGEIGTYVTAVFYALMGVHRLAYFHIAKTEGTATHFIGVPLTYIALAVPVFYTLFKVVGLEASPMFRMGLHLVYLLMALAFVWNRPISKPSGKMYLFFVVLAIAVIALLSVG